MASYGGGRRVNFRRLCCAKFSKMNALARSSTIAAAVRATTQVIPSGATANPVLAERVIAAPAQPKLTSQILRNAITPKCSPIASVGLGGKHFRFFTKIFMECCSY